MRFARYHSSLLLIGALLLGGCFPVVRYADRPRLECADPPPVCRPDTFNEIRIDTSAAVGLASHYLSITQVAGLNSDDDEFSVAFAGADGGRGIATIRRPGGQPVAEELTAVRFQGVARAARDRDLNAAGIDGAVGGPSLAGRDSIYLAARPAGSVLGDYDIFAGEYRGGSVNAAAWSGISSLVYWDAQPSVAPDGRAVYFASDRPGGFGGTDIYVSRRAADGTWSAPENLGAGVNTPCDELSPWASGNGRWLYFSSAGHATVGGYDLFRAEISAGQFARASNLGRPINTAADELFPSAPSSADSDTLLYYTSNQAGASGFDIYVLHRLRRPGRSVTNADPRTVDMTGIVRDPQGRPISGARVTVEPRDPPGPPVTVSTDPQGGFTVPVKEGRTYRITTGSQTTLYTGEEIRIPIMEGHLVFPHDVVIPDTVTFRVNFPFNDASNPYLFTLDENGLPSNLRWTDMIDQAAAFLQQFNTNRDYRFLITGHTDPVGSDPFNLDLGRRRAEFIRNELVKRGVSAGLLTVGSEGESRMLAPRAEEDEDRYHARLRRVELIRLER